MTTQRASTWSLTINNPTESDTNVTLPAGWKLEGQYEVGENETRHFQGMLSTPQCRFSSVKKLFPRAHIEVARNRAALKTYVHKDDTRVGDFATQQSTFVNLSDAKRLVCERFCYDDWMDWLEKTLIKHYKGNRGECFLAYVDCVVRNLITGDDGGEVIEGIEYHAVTPGWRQMWKLFGEAILERHEKLRQQQTDRQTDTADEAAKECLIH